MTDGQHQLLTVPVRAAGQPWTAARQGTHFTQLIDSGTQPVAQLLGRDYDRVTARVLSADQPVILAQSKEIAEAAAQYADQPAFSLTSDGTVTDPGAGAVIAAGIVLAPGRYRVTATAFAAGTVAAGDASNMRVYCYQGSPQSTVIPYPAVAGTAGTVTFTAAFTQALGEVTVYSIAAASGAAAVYSASLVATPLAAQPDAVPPAGSYLPAGTDRVIDNCDELWVAALTPAPTRVSVVVSRKLPE